MKPLDNGSLSPAEQVVPPPVADDPTGLSHELPKPAQPQIQGVEPEPHQNAEAKQSECRGYVHPDRPSPQDDHHDHHAGGGGDEIEDEYDFEDVDDRVGDDDGVGDDDRGDHRANPPAQPGPEAGAAVADDPCMRAVEAEEKFLGKRFGSNKPILEVKHCDVQALLALNALNGRPKIALKGFLSRYARNPWMKGQHFYAPSAALAAAHDRFAVVHYEHGLGYFLLGGFSGTDFCNCGWAVEGSHGHIYFLRCRQIEYCPSCNRWLRVEPAKAEFLPAFSSAPLWFGITIMARSKPELAGVKVIVGEDDDDNLIYESLFSLSDTGEYPRLPRYDAASWAAPMVGLGLYDFMRWLIGCRYFDGLHVAGDISFTFFPDPKSPVGVSHTINPHFHAYGNTSRPFDSRRATLMFMGALNALLRAGHGRLWAYPDICLRPLPTPEAMKKAINYVFKPFRFAKDYIRGLRNGCPVVGLNMEFHTTYFGSEALLYPIPSPSGLSAYGAKLGNMSQRAGGDYIGEPLAKQMSAQQVKRFLERLAKNEASAWEILRYDKHLALLAGRRQRAARASARNAGPNAPSA